MGRRFQSALIAVLALFIGCSSVVAQATQPDTCFDVLKRAVESPVGFDGDDPMAQKFFSEFGPTLQKMREAGTNSGTLKLRYEDPSKVKEGERSRFEYQRDVGECIKNESAIFKIESSSEQIAKPFDIYLYFSNPIGTAFGGGEEPVVGYIYNKPNQELHDVSITVSSATGGRAGKTSDKRKVRQKFIRWVDFDAPAGRNPKLVLCVNECDDMYESMKKMQDDRDKDTGPLSTRNNPEKTQPGLGDGETSETTLAAQQAVEEKEAEEIAVSQYPDPNSNTSGIDLANHLSTKFQPYFVDSENQKTVTLDEYDVKACILRSKNPLNLIEEYFEECIELSEKDSRDWKISSIKFTPEISAKGFFPVEIRLKSLGPAFLTGIEVQRSFPENFGSIKDCYFDYRITAVGEKAAQFVDEHALHEVKGIRGFEVEGKSGFRASFFDFDNPSTGKDLQERIPKPLPLKELELQIISMDDSSCRAKDEVKFALADQNDAFEITSNGQVIFKNFVVESTRPDIFVFLSAYKGTPPSGSGAGTSEYYPVGFDGDAQDLTANFLSELFKKTPGQTYGAIRIIKPDSDDGTWKSVRSISAASKIAEADNLAEAIAGDLEPFEGDYSDVSIPTFLNTNAEFTAGNSKIVVFGRSGFAQDVDPCSKILKDDTLREKTHFFDFSVGYEGASEENLLTTDVYPAFRCESEMASHVLAVHGEKRKFNWRQDSKKATSTFVETIFEKNLEE